MRKARFVFVTVESVEDLGLESTEIRLSCFSTSSKILERLKRKIERSVVVFNVFIVTVEREEKLRERNERLMEEKLKKRQ